MPRPLTTIPPTAYDASALLASRGRRTLGRRDALQRRGSGRIDLDYKGLDGLIRPLITYRASGDVTIRVRNAFDLGEFRRFLAVLPHGWSATWRTHRRRPQLFFRGVYNIGWEPVTFFSNGDVGYGLDTSGPRITWADLNREADERESVTPMRSRRSRPRPIPSYAVFTDAPLPPPPAAPWSFVIGDVPLRTSVEAALATVAAHEHNWHTCNIFSPWHCSICLVTQSEVE